MMIYKRLMTKKFLVGLVLGVTLSAVIISGCAADTGLGDGRDSDLPTESQGVLEREGGDSEGEHSSGGEGNESSGGGNGLVVMAVVQVLTAVKRAVKLPCRAQSHLSDSRGRVFSVDWLFLWSTMQQASRSTERYETRSHRYFAMCRPNLT